MPAVYPYPKCVILPLGSPTGTRKRSYVHVPRVPAAVVSAVLPGCAGPGWVPGGVYRVGTGRGIPGGYYPAPTLVLPGPNEANYGEIQLKYPKVSIKP